ncbi:PhzF family phenazine biosynthesis isomerase, partial [Pedobacter psychrodurus]|uniref:PhzF family phenazine biosynthesis protein n=1 Tax=Pedobacter psychrodurus TaxID=2530456 RepID=UPI00292D8EAD
MKLDLYQIDAFTDEIFRGNPACVVPLKEWLPDEILFKITQENAVAETAFFIDKGTHIHLRWFTPEIEMDLCGHATLAATHVLHTIMNYGRKEIIFETASGALTVTINEDVYALDFPSRKPIAAPPPEIIVKALNIQPLYVLKSRDYILVYETEQQI